MILKKVVIILLFALLALFPASPARADLHTVGDISKQLICQCGCTMILSKCQCDTAAAMTTVIEQKLAQGQSGEQIIQFFVAQYGEQVLASPPKRGFNLVAWVLPFGAILGGGGVIYISLKRWVWQGRRSQTGIMAGAEEGNEEYQRRLDKELEEFTERGFR